MNHQKNQIKDSEVELIIEVSPNEAMPFLGKAAVRLSQTSKIEGFRPGHAPYNVIKQRVGEMGIYKEALDDIISHYYFQAVTLEKLQTIGSPKIEVEKIAPENPIIFKATVALMPQIVLGNYRAIKVKRNEIKISDNQVAKMLDDLKKMQAKETLVDREAKIGDFVEADFEVSMNNIVIEGGTGRKYPLVLGEGALIPGFEEQLAGLKKDQEKHFQLKFPEEYQNKMVAGKLCDFKVKIISVFERILPEVNDDWAKTLGASNVADLKAKIRKNLKNEEVFHEEQRAEIEMLNKIIEQTKFSEIPDLLIENEAHRMAREFEDSISNQGIAFVDYLKGLNKEKNDLIKEFKPKALERVKASLVIKEIAEKEKIEISEHELKEETEKILKQAAGNKEAEENIISEGYQSYLRTIVRNRKVIEMLKAEVIK